MTGSREGSSDSSGLPPGALPPEYNRDRHLVGSEFQLEGITFRYDGPAHTGTAFSSSDPVDGRTRSFIVYRSNSEGALRVSQAYIRGVGSYVKGMNSLAGHQYTQDTQLHPGFAEQAGPYIEADTRPAAPQDEQFFADLHRYNSGQLSLGLGDPARIDAAVADFGAQVKVLPLGSRELDAELRIMDAGGLNWQSMLDIAGLEYGSKEQAWERYHERLEALNSRLAEEGVIPDFSGAPEWSEQATHPLIGAVTREVYFQNHNERPYQWHVVRDPSGHYVWVDRVRLADSDPTAYGTDEEMVMSGILTSKPLEHPHESDGLPSGLTLSGPHRYYDITPFLNLLEPIKQYREQRGIPYPPAPERLTT